ncbi:protein aveugle-like [Calypte anna]|uniref:protein aveugle-like n=1 Tax=Calypte anna TaxID=9244 RepID=UPI0011C3F859|nr:protein aveugle-like [Calypte anna]
MDPWVRDGAEEPLEQWPTTEQRPVGHWSVAEVGSWLAARGWAGDLVEVARDHHVSGRVLLRVTEGTLQRMGVTPGGRRRDLLRDVLRLRLQQELRDLLSIAAGEPSPHGPGTRGAVGARAGRCSASPLSPE